jgi:hypothetical protein
MIKTYVTPNDMKKLNGKKGIILDEFGDLTLVKTSNNDITIFTVWDCLTAFTFCDTFDELEARETFSKFKNFRSEWSKNV